MCLPEDALLAAGEETVILVTSLGQAEGHLTDEKSEDYDCKGVQVCNGRLVFKVHEQLGRHVACCPTH